MANTTLSPPQQNTDTAPPQRNAPASPNQTDATAQLPAAVANDPAWAARVALNQRLNPAAGPAALSQPQQQLFSRALPSNGGPTPTFAPAPASSNAVPATPADAGAKLNAVLTGGASDQLATQGPKTLQEAQSRLQSFASPEADRQRAILNSQVPGTTEHVLANAHAHTPDEFKTALRGVPRFQIMQLLQHLTPPSMQEQAMAHALQGAATNGAPGDVQRELNLLAFGSSPGLMYSDPRAFMNIGVKSDDTPQRGRGAVDPNVAK